MNFGKASFTEFFAFHLTTNLTQISWANDSPWVGTGNLTTLSPFSPSGTEHSPPSHVPLSLTARITIPCLCLFFNPCSVTSEKLVFSSSLYSSPNFQARVPN